jgi:hypothetical protein
MKIIKVNYKAVRVKSKPTVVEFFDKKGQKLFFKGTTGELVFDPNKLKTPDLIKWLKKNDLKNLAVVLEKIIKHINK